MLNSQPLIHIGYPKAASTWLQRTIFNNENAGFVNPWGHSASIKAFDVITLTNSFRFSAESIFKYFEPDLQKATEEGLVPVISHESLSGNQILGQYWGKEVADRIYSVFPEAKILIIIREQKSLIMSSYQQHIKKGGSKTLQQFIGKNIEKPGFQPLCRLDYLEYDLLIEYYQNLFGKQNILVLPFELLKHKPQTLIQKIINFADSNGKLEPYYKKAENVGLKWGTLAFLQQINRFIEKPDFSSSRIPLTEHGRHKVSIILDRLIPNNIHQGVEKRWKSIIRDYVGDYFRESNRKTSSLIDTNLAGFDYDC